MGAAGLRVRLALCAWRERSLLRRAEGEGSSNFQVGKNTWGWRAPAREFWVCRSASEVGMVPESDPTKTAWRNPHSSPQGIYTPQKDTLLDFSCTFTSITDRCQVHKTIHGRGNPLLALPAGTCLPWRNLAPWQAKPLLPVPHWGVCTK